MTYEGNGRSYQSFRNKVEGERAVAKAPAIGGHSSEVIREAGQEIAADGYAPDTIDALFSGANVLKAASTEQCSGDLIDEIDKELFLSGLSRKGASNGGRTKTTKSGGAGR